MARGIGRLRRAAVSGRPAAPVAPEVLLELAREGPQPLVRRRVADDALRVAVVIPSFRRGSGGHQTIVHLLRGLETRGHDVSLWLEDNEALHRNVPPVRTARSFREFFGPLSAELRVGFDDWDGADVVVATGWQTAARALRLKGCVARAYLVQDHEPDFHPASADSTWAAQTYSWAFHCIAASRWLAHVLRERYGARTSHFDLGVDHAVYRPIAITRRDDLVVFYARAVTPRRAVPLGLLALEELRRRRPHLQIALFGDNRPIMTSFGHCQLGVLNHDALARIYNEATVGFALSLTNPSLIPLEMMACGLSCVELATPATVETFGANGPLVLSRFDPIALADALELLLDDPEQRSRRAEQGLELVSQRSWDGAAAQLEAALREALS